MKTSSMKIARIAMALLAIGHFTTATQAAPAPQPTDTFIVADDGYLIVDDNGDAQKLPPRVCPPGATNPAGDGCVIINPHPFSKDTPVATVTPQRALDLAYGPNHAKLIGIAPQGWHSTVIYYRILPATGR
jgi:hypothetical protein